MALNESDSSQVDALFHSVEGRMDVAIYNPYARSRGPVADLNAKDVRRVMRVTAFGSFLLGCAAAKRMQSRPGQKGKRGTILFTGAS